MMQCHQCQKLLNDMTLYCDRCGTKLQEAPKPFSFENIDRLLLKKTTNTKYPGDLQEDIKKAHYLTTIYAEESKEKCAMIDQYLNYTLVRIIYERDKNILLTKDYPVQKAKAILHSLVHRRVTKDIQRFIDEEYPEEVLKCSLPKEVLADIDDIHITDFSVYKKLPTKSPLASILGLLLGILISFVKYGIIIGVILAGYLTLQGVEVQDLPQEAYNLIMDYVPITVLMGVGALILLLGLIRGLKNNKTRFITKIMKQNKSFYRHVKQVCSKRLKTLNYRIKKGS